jgi:phosphatidylinositol alpha-1,6-mannosyltransferase
LHPEDVVVLTSRWRGWQEWDRTQGFTVVRHDAGVLLPTPSVRRHAVELFREHGCTDVWFGAAAPLGLLAEPLRAAGAQRLVATTHGHEVGWAALPVARSLLRRIAAKVDVVTYLGDYTRTRLMPALAPYDDRLRRLVPGVDTELFAPGDAGTDKRAELGLSDRPVVVCVSRLMPRKGQDTLVAALPAIRRRVPDTALVLVGGGPSRQRLLRLAETHGVADHVIIRGSVDHRELAGWYAVGDVFAMPCRQRLGGLDVEGLGMVFLEAAACGLPVVAGTSGGSVDAVLDRSTGRIVSGGDVGELSEVLAGLLSDPAQARDMGRRGREWVRQSWSWDATVRDFTSFYEGFGPE